MRRGRAVLVRACLTGMAGAAALCLLASDAPAAPPGTSSAAVNWYQEVVADLHPLQATLVSGLQAASAWQQGTASSAAAARAINRGLPTLMRVQRRLARLAPLPGHAIAHDDYQAAIGLYADAFRLELTATGVDAPEVVAQLQRSFQRIRALGDITFDQGTAELAPLLGDVIAGPDVQAADRVPDWTVEGIAPGAPLVAAWPAAGPSSSGPPAPSEWAAAVAHDGAPSQSSVRRALARGATSPATLARLSVRLGTAAAALGTVLVPARDRRASDVARLGLLVDAEATLADRAGRLVRGAERRQLERVGVSLGSAGATLREQSATAG